MKFRIITAAMLSILLLFSGAVIANQDFDEEEGYTVKVGSVSFEPAEAAMEAPLIQGNRFILQFRETPAPETIEALKSEGIELVKYINGHAFYARATHTLDSNQVAGIAALRATVPITTTMKIDPVFEESVILQNRISTNSPEKYIIKFHEDSTPEEMEAFIRQHGLEIDEDLRHIDKFIQVNAPWTKIESSLSADIVEQVEPGMPPKKNLDKLVKFRTNSQRTTRRFRFRNMNGFYAKVGFWESAKAANHTDFQDRLTIVENTSGTSDHATNVAGIIGGEGILDGFVEGQAPNVKLFSYDWNDVFSELRTAKLTNDIFISNHSWGYTAGWDSDDDDGETIYTWNFDWLFQNYGSTSEAVDDMIRDLDILVVKSAGNDRGDSHIGPWKSDSDDSSFRNDLRPSDPQYGSLVSFSNAKNLLTVGATMRDNSMTGFSAWGPTADGRIKPDVVAPGHSVRTTNSENSYEHFHGTSASAPAASGAAALLADQYWRINKKDISALLLKNIMIHTTVDLGRPGPDYQFGHGMLDVHMAGRVIKKAVYKEEDWPTVNLPKRDEDPNLFALVIDDTIQQGDRIEYRIDLHKNFNELRGTLVWHDPGNRTLVNDIDFEMREVGGKRIFPWRLAKNNPTRNAWRANNSIDNVERIDVENPSKGVWIIVVRGKKIRQGPERFTLVVSASDGNRQFPLKHDVGQLGSITAFASGSDDYQNAEEKNTFVTGDTLFLYSYVQVLNNAHYADFDADGAVRGDWKLIYQDGMEKLHTSTSIELPTNSPGQSWILRLGEYEIPSAMPRGTYTLEITMVMPNGDTAVGRDTFTVN